MLTVEHDDSAILPGMFRIAVTAPGQTDAVIQDVPGPFALIGRTGGCTCHFDHPDVARRHAYLQAYCGRIYCVDLCGGTLLQGVHRKGGWLDPGQIVGIGPYRIQLIDSVGLGARREQLADDFDLLDHYAGQLGPLPRFEIEFLTGSGAAADSALTISRPITLLGSSPRCKLRLDDKSVSSVHCSLLWLRDGLWVVDLAGKGGVRVRNKNRVLHSAKLGDGHKLRVGQFLMRVHASGEFSVASEGEGQPDGRKAAPSIVFHRPKVVAEPGTSAEKQKIADERARLAAERQALERERSAMQTKAEQLDGQQQAFDARLQQIEAREAKLVDAQQRLASEWERLHADRAALKTFEDDLARRHGELEFQARGLGEGMADLQRKGARLQAEWHQLVEARARFAEARQQLISQRDEMAALRKELSRRRSEKLDQEQTLPAQDEAETAVDLTLEQAGSNPADPAASGGEAETPEDASWTSASAADGENQEFDVMEATRHNIVFRTEREGSTLVVIPLGDASEFLYQVVHTESNKVRRLLEGGGFQNLVVDLGSATIASNVMVNVIVSLSRIAANRGGRALMCNATEEMRVRLQSMKLAELWPQFASRDEARQFLASSTP